MAAATAIGLHINIADLGTAGRKAAPAPGRRPAALLNPETPGGGGGGGDGIEMEHLIVGVLLGTPLLFLAPTTLVFHAFAALLAAGAAALQVGSCDMLRLRAAFMW